MFSLSLGSCTAGKIEPNRALSLATPQVAPQESTHQAQIKHAEDEKELL